MGLDVEGEERSVENGVGKSVELLVQCKRDMKRENGFGAKRYEGVPGGHEI